MKLSIRCGSTGMMIPSASVARTMVMKMNATAAWRPPTGAAAVMDRSAVLQHRARHELAAAEAGGDTDVEQHADADQRVAGLAAEPHRRAERAAGGEHV